MACVNFSIDTILEGRNSNLKGHHVQDLNCSRNVLHLKLKSIFAIEWISEGEKCMLGNVWKEISMALLLVTCIRITSPLYLSHCICHIAFITLHLLHCIYHIAFITLHLPHKIYHIALHLLNWVYHIEFITLHLSHWIYQIAYITLHLSHCIYHIAFITLYHHTAFIT